MIDNVLVFIGSLGIIAFVVWFFWMGRKKGTRLGVTPAGIQEGMILVKGGYSPDLVLVEHGKPVRLNFRREESQACSEVVLLPDFGKSAQLPEGKVVPLEFLPEKPGEYEFHCRMGMFRGKVVVV